MTAEEKRLRDMAENENNCHWPLANTRAAQWAIAEIERLRLENAELRERVARTARLLAQF